MKLLVARRVIVRNALLADGAVVSKPANTSLPGATFPFSLLVIEARILSKFPMPLNHLFCNLRLSN